MSVNGLILQPRDLEIIKFIAKYPLADIKCIKEYCFPKATVTAASRRIKKLFEHGLLSRMSSITEGAFRYYVSKKNIQLAGLEERKTKRVQKAQLIHDIELYDFLRELKANLHELDRIIPDFELQQYAKRNYRQTFTYKGKVQSGELRFLPDALLTVGGKHIFVEWDRNTIHGINLFRKVLAYGMFFQELKNTRTNFDLSNFAVMFICPCEKRCINIAKIFRNNTKITNIVTTTTYPACFSHFVSREKY